MLSDGETRKALAVTAPCTPCASTHRSRRQHHFGTYSGTLLHPTTEANHTVHVSRDSSAQGDTMPGPLPEWTGHSKQKKGRGASSSQTSELNPKPQKCDANEPHQPATLENSTQQQRVTFAIGRVSYRQVAWKLQVPVTERLHRAPQVLALKKETIMHWLKKNN